MILRALAIPFRSLSEPLGGGAFRERFMPSAVRRTVDEGIDLRALVGHDHDKVLGRVSSRTLTLHVDNVGLHVAIEPPATTYAEDLLKVIQRGDVTGVSFGFQALEDTWAMESGMPIRSVVDARIYEVSIVTWPSYSNTHVALA